MSADKQRDNEQATVSKSTKFISEGSENIGQ